MASSPIVLRGEAAHPLLQIAQAERMKVLRLDRGRNDVAEQRLERGRADVAGRFLLGVEVGRAPSGPRGVRRDEHRPRPSSLAEERLRRARHRLDLRVALLGPAVVGIGHELGLELGLVELIDEASREGLGG